MYSQFHKTLPISSLQMHWISVRFYEMGDMLFVKIYFIIYQSVFLVVGPLRGGAGVKPLSH